MKKFEVGQMVRVVRFDVSDAGYCRDVFLPGAIENGQFEIIEVWGGHIPDYRNSIVVSLKGTSSCGKRFIDRYHWVFPKCCLEHVAEDSFRKRVVMIKSKRQRGL